MTNFAYLSNVKDKKTVDKTYEEVMDVARSETVKGICKQIADALDADDQELASTLKYKLPCVVWNRSYGTGNRIKKDTGTPTGVVMTDWDCCQTEEEARQLGSDLQSLSLTDEWVKEHLLAAHISPRRHGIHALWKWVDGCHSIEEVQEEIQKHIKFPEMDASCKDNSRKSFLVSTDMFLYMSDAMCHLEDSANLQKEQEILNDKTRKTKQRSAATARGTSGNGDRPDQASAEAGEKTAEEVAFPTKYNGIEYSQIIASLVKKISKKSQLDAFGNPSQGNRHLTWLKVASQLRTICDNNADWLCAIAPQWAFDSEGTDVHATCVDACEEKLPYGIPKKLSDIIDSLTEEAEEENEKNSDAKVLTWLDDFHSRYKFPTMPKYLEPLMQGVPKGYEDAMLLHLMSMYAAMCFSKVRGRYLDGKVHAPNLQVIIEGNWGQGKGKFEDVYKALFARIIELDKQKLFEEAAWDEKAERTSANKDLEQRPHQIVQTAGIGITKSKMTDVLADNQGVHLYMFESEILAVVNALKKQYGLTYEHFRKAYENGDVYQNTKSRSSKTGIFPVYLNYTFTGTPADTQKFIGKELEGGTASRICWSVIPESERYMSRLVLPCYTEIEAMRDKIDEWREKYVYSRKPNDKGEDEDVPADPIQLDMEYINDALADWLDKQWMLWEVDGNAARKDARGRMGSMAFHCALVLHMLFGCPKQDEKKVRKQVVDATIYIANYCMERFLHKFSESQNEQRKQNRKAEIKQKSKNELDYVKKKFRREDLVEALKKVGKTTEVRVVISRLAGKGLIERIKGSDYFNKLV